MRPWYPLQHLQFSAIALTSQPEVTTYGYVSLLATLNAI
jgi:hypothetical protein